MLKTLWSLYLKQKRRGWRWAVFFASAYIIVLFWAIMIGMYWALGNELDDILKPYAWNVIKPLCMSLMLADLMGTFLFKHDNGIMDDYLKTKPISLQEWNRFLFLTNIIDFNNWFVVITLLPILFLLLPFHVALIAVVMLFIMSYINGIVAMEHRKAKGWEYKLGVWTIYIVYLFGALLFPLWIVYACTIVVLYHYLFHLHRYNESKVTMSQVRSIKNVSFIWLQLLLLLRAKRIRMMLVMGVIFALYAYFPGTDMENEVHGNSFYMFLALFFLPMFFGSLGFGVEANFFHGIVSKPIGVERILESKYYMMVFMTIVTTLISSGSILIGRYDVWLYVSTVLFVMGFAILFSLPTCLYGKRIDLFAGSYMNMQGANWTFNFYTLAPLLPMIVFGAILAFINDVYICAGILAVLGMVGFFCHKLWIKWMAYLFDKNKYKLLDRYSE